MKLTLKIWRQKNRNEKGAFVKYPVDDVDPEMSVLECLDVLNESLILRGEVPVAFEHDCREGICGSCGFVINGVAHGPERGTTACQLTMRHFKDGDELTLEPWRAKAFPLVKDLVVNRRAPGPHHRSRRICFSLNRAGSRRQYPSGGQGDCRSVDGRCRLHRLWSMRCGLSQRIGCALHWSQDYTPRSSSPGRTRARAPSSEHGGADECRSLRQLHQHR